MRYFYPYMQYPFFLMWMPQKHTKSRRKVEYDLEVNNYILLVIPDYEGLNLESKKSLIWSFVTNLYYSKISWTGLLLDHIIKCVCIGFVTRISRLLLLRWQCRMPKVTSLSPISEKHVFAIIAICNFCLS
jgi:hypothetical protein